MKKYVKYKKNDAVTNIKYSKIHKNKFEQARPQKFSGEINFRKLYIPVEYPVRTEFKEYVKNNKMNKYKTDYVYSGFEDRKIDFSTFLATPHILEFTSEVNIEMKEAKRVKFNLKLCGEAEIYVNNKFSELVSQLTRVNPIDNYIELYLEAGNNKVEILLRDIAERDINFSYELIYLGENELTTYTEVDNLQKYDEITALLESFYFEKDIVNDGNIKYFYDNNILSEDIILNLEVKYNDIPYFDSYEPEEEKNPLFADSGIKKQISFIKDSNYGILDFSNDKDFTSYVVITYKENDMYFVRRIFLSKYTIDTKYDLNLKERKKFAIDHIAKKGKDFVLRCYLDLQQNNKLSTENIKIIKQQMNFINRRNDCADFEIIGLILLYEKFSPILPEEIKTEMYDVIINFRYWCDEPGTDVMWYFSENHALSFHSAQFLAGNIFKDETFKNSGKKGFEQAQIGLARLIDWFKTFNEHGLGEWNSTTYIPIDLNALFALYNQKFSDEISKQAKIALDYCFETIQNNLTGNIMSSSYGRVYEKHIKAMEFGELAFITWIMWNKGMVNYSSRAVGMYLISDYHFEYNKQVGEIIKFEGYADVETYTYKFEEASMSSVVDYYPGEEGFQQHVMNVDLGNNTQIWINHPGELLPSGEGRPSYWAGSHILPKIEQKNNQMKIYWNLKDELIDFVHMYIPYWKCNIDFYENKYIITNDRYQLEINSKNNFKLITEGANAFREVRFYGDDIEITLELTEILSN